MPSTPLLSAWTKKQRRGKSSKKRNKIETKRWREGGGGRKERELLTISSDTQNLRSKVAPTPYLSLLRPHSPTKVLSLSLSFSPLYSSSDLGVNWVMHCVGPNMNPKKSDCIESYEESTPILKKTFESMLSSMYDIALGKHDY